MDEDKLKIAAEQLRKPNGDMAVYFGEKMNEGNRALYQNTFPLLKLNDNDTVLEIGMGNGHFVKDIINMANNITYHGCDYSEAMIEQSNLINKILVKSGKAQFHLSNANDLHFSNHYFNLVFSINTIYFWEDPTKILSEFYRMLRPDGKLVLSLRPKSSMSIYPFVKYGFKLFSKTTLKNLLEKNKFIVKSIIEKEESVQKVEDLDLKVESLIVVAEKLNTGDLNES